MVTPDPNASVYDDIASCIGNVCIWWAGIEDVILGLSLHTAQVLEPAFDTSMAWNMLHIALLNMDPRARIANAKAAIHYIDDPRSADIYDRAEALLNFVDNSLRPERNRYVHDVWAVRESASLARMKPIAIVTRPQSRKRELQTYVEHEFKNIEDARRLVTALEDAFGDLVTLDSHLAWLASHPERPSKFPQPLPVEWRSFAHREWLARDRRPHPTQPSPASP